jgi:hypothetical protein
MTNRFPKGVRVTYTKTEAVPPSGYNWKVSDTAGFVIAYGWCPGTKSEAREAAWRALEETGAVVDA